MTNVLGMPDELSTGESIKRARQLKRWTQQRLADMVGVHVSAVVAWENDQHFPARNRFLIEEVLGITLGEPAEAAS